MTLPYAAFHQAFHRIVVLLQNDALSAPVLLFRSTLPEHLCSSSSVQTLISFVA